MIATGSVSPVAFWISGSYSVVSTQPNPPTEPCTTNLRPHKHIMLLLIANRELALRLLVRVGERVQGFNSLALQDRQPEADVGLCVFVAGLRLVNTTAFVRRVGNSQKPWYHPATPPM